MILIKGGKIKPITGAEIENGELLIGDDGKIAAIGKNVDAPADAKVIDATGCLVTPGFIDAHCHIGIDEEGMRWEGNDCNEYSSPVTPEMRSIDGINPRDEAFHLALEGGDHRPRLGECPWRHVCCPQTRRQLHRRHDCQVPRCHEDCFRREPQGLLWSERP